ncbi:MAG TPA: sulfatase-like hydrolase/transferase [Bryobacteraceae bacterium]|nr:sulfatase-like hydrolase/transferase [Bryobacteraceae bacterium]
MPNSISRRGFLAAGTAPLVLTGAPSRPRPNILWISCEDTGPEIGCYGDRNSITPNIDRIASEGVRYSHAYSVAGVCAPSRSAIITGMYPSTLGSQYMRCRAPLPDFVRCFPEYLRDAGYYCTNSVKTDYNFEPPKSAWDELHRTAHWKNRPKDKPFFSVFNLEITHESRVRMRGAEHEKNVARLKASERRDPKSITLPPYYPDGEPAHRDWANYLELITAMDYQAGDRLREIEQAGLLEDTMVFFWGDHGVGLPRGKRWLYESGTHVPLVIRIPKKFRTASQGAPASVDSQLLSFVDLAPTVLNLAGAEIPKHMQGRAFLGPKLTPERKYIYGIRDRMDERNDCVRMVRGQRYRYLRNYVPHKPYAQEISYMNVGPTQQELRRLKAEGKLPDAARLYMSDTKPPEELYDVERDPHELRNLTDSREHRGVLVEMRMAQERWALRTRDLGLIPEAIVDARGKEYGSRYAILHKPGSEEYIRRLRSVADDVNHKRPVTYTREEPDPAIRYWTALGAADPALALQDSEAVVRIVAAERLKNIDALAREMKSTNEWVRHQAALALDELGSGAEILKPYVGDPSDYVQRVARHACGM